MEYCTNRRHCFIEEDDGLASLAEMKRGFSGNNNNNNYPLVSRPLYYTQRRSSLRNLRCLHSVSSQRRSYYDAEHHHHHHHHHLQQPHFLDACFLCKKPLFDRDIYMYRGDTPFCSEECRQEQIEMDEAKEKSWNLSASMKSLRKNEQRTSSPNKASSRDRPYRTGTVAAA